MMGAQITVYSAAGLACAPGRLIKAPGEPNRTFSTDTPAGSSRSAETPRLVELQRSGHEAEMTAVGVEQPSIREHQQTTA